MHDHITDRPIACCNEDGFNRRELAGHLARGIVNYDNSESSLVVAIYGEWGSGKTSFKNMVVEEINRLNEAVKHPQKTVEACEYNPWRWSGEEEIYSSFITRVMAAIGNKKTQKSNDILKGFSGYHKAISAAGGLLQLGGMAYSFVDPVTGPVAVGVGKGVEASGKPLKNTAELLKIFSKSLEERFEELRQKMKSVNERVLIVIDDVDRLHSSEIQLVFQVLKVHLDLPNLSFLLLCQRDIVEESLGCLFPKSDNLKEPGREYLDKIVHFGLTMPVLSKKQRSYMLARLVKSSLGSGIDFENGNSKVYAEFVTDCISTPRKLNRLANSLGFLNGVFRIDKVLTIYPEHLLVLEALRAAYPELHSELYKHEDQLAGEQYYPETIKSITEAKGFNQGSSLTKSLKLIFSRSGENTDAGERAIGNRSVFQRYFSLFVE